MVRAVERSVSMTCWIALRWERQQPSSPREWLSLLFQWGDQAFVSMLEPLIASKKKSIRLENVAARERASRRSERSERLSTRIFSKCCA